MRTNLLTYMTGNLSASAEWKNSPEHLNLVRALEGKRTGNSSIHLASMTATESFVLLHPVSEAYLTATVPFLLRMHSCDRKECARCDDQRKLFVEYGLADSGKLSCVDVVRFFKNHYFGLDHKLPNDVEALSIPLLVDDLDTYIAGGDLPTGTIHNRHGADYRWCPVGEIQPKSCVYIFVKKKTQCWLWIFRCDTQRYWEATVIRASWAYVMTLPTPLCMGDFLRSMLLCDIIAE